MKRSVRKRSWILTLVFLHSPFIGLALGQTPPSPPSVSPAVPPATAPATPAAASTARAISTRRAPRIVSPASGVSAFGTISVVVDPGTPNPRGVEIWYNDVKAGTLAHAPWKLSVETGDENIERRFRVVVIDAAGGRTEVQSLLPPVHVDEEIDLPLQQLYITATVGGYPELGLKREDFSVLDQGKSQEIVTFEHGDVPLAAVLLIDSSLSMRGAPLRSALAGAKSFASGMAELDEAMLLLFSDRVVHHTAWSANPEQLLAGLTGAEARGGSAVNDHLFLSLELLEKRQGRRVVILLSDGVDVESLLSAAQVNEIAVRSQALIYWIRVSADAFDLKQRSAWRTVEEHSAEIRQLAATVDASGGRRIEIRRYEDAPSAFQQILTELRQQYVLGFYPNALRHDGSWHPIRINVESKGVQLRTREGYYDDP
ncbi:MAG: VWA domain-containing protein [Thermoanaerobaculia bacterium]